MHISLLKPGALSVFHGYQIQSCLLDRDQPLAVFLAALPEWKTVYADDVSVVLVHTNAGNGAATTAVENDSVNLAAHLQ
jgi:hypothetical protein